VLRLNLRAFGRPSQTVCAETGPESHVGNPLPYRTEGFLPATTGPGKCLADRLFQCVPRPKRRDFQRRDFDLFFGIAGIYAGAGGALAHFEGAEPADHYGAAFFELPRDRLADGVKRGGSGFFADAGLLGDPTEKARDGFTQQSRGHLTGW
jgi:hypothetical protein